MDQNKKFDKTQAYLKLLGDILDLENEIRTRTPGTEIMFKLYKTKQQNENTKIK